MRKGPDDYGGMWGQLQKLRAGRHPKTGEVLPAPVDCEGKADDDLGRYANLDRRNADINALSVVPYVAENNFAPYIPLPSREFKPNTGRSAKDKMADMLKRVQHKEIESKKQYRLRGKQKAPTSHCQLLADESANDGPPAERKICWRTRRRIETANG